MNKKTSKGRYAFVSLGCPKNLVDSERMLGLLQLDGYQLVADPEGTDFVIVNTCGFIEQARQESYATIDEMLQLKTEGKTRGVIVTGCLAERQKEQLLADRPEIDFLVGVFGREEIARVADRFVGDLQEQRMVFQPAPVRAFSDCDRFRVTPRHFAYVKISEGCDRLCTFCSIPKIRGPHVSKPLEQIVDEGRQLARDGVRELILVAQDSTSYGVDLYGVPRLADLLLELQQVDVDWIRVMYFYPEHIDDRLIRTIGDSTKILPYIDLPLQHIHDGVLRRMARRVSRHDTLQLIDRLRTGIANLTLRTTFITGFPGETDAAFDELAAFVRRQRFERLGVFSYSREENTPADRLDGHVPEGTREERRRVLMEIQQRIAFAANEAQVGQTKTVLVDRPVPDAPGAWIARSAADAPDIDGLVFLTENDQHKLSPGAMTECEIVTFQEYDLIAVATGTPW